MLFGIEAAGREARRCLTNILSIYRMQAPVV